MEITLKMAMDRLASLHEVEVMEPPWSDSKISDFENYTKCVVPSQLRQILQEIASFYAGYTPGFLAHFETGLVTKNEVRTIVDARENMEISSDIFRHDTTFPGRFPFDMIFMGDANGGHTQLVTGGGGAHDNAVYAWPNSTSRWETGHNIHGLGKVADTIFEFIYNLQHEEDI